MSWLLFYYIMLIIFAVLAAFLNSRGKIGYSFFFLVFIGYSYLSRTDEPKNDTLAYDNFMQLPLSYYYDFYYLREPIYWFSSKFLYDYFENTIPVYIFIDLLSIALFLYALYKSKYQTYFLYIFTVFFVSVLGFQNVYRQYLATFFIIASLFLLADRKHIWKLVTLGFGVLTHNVAALFFPMLLASKKINSIWKMLIALLPLAIALRFLSGSKSNTETGETDPILYVIVFLLTMILFMALNKLRFTGKYLKYFYYYIYSAILIAISLPLFGQAQVKRVAMICLLISLFILYETIENKFKDYQLIVMRIIFVLLSVAPIAVSTTLQEMLS
ncbi:EpsG family protein [Acinetobacter sp. YH12140]|uniref:EpsG family protein n=1 Tax=Acinetobacter sp. YH12140 TaxID=2601124 RepID=UPI0015D33A7C|nr:EpsG family protein [Acinetobacter sp. YH12140]